MKGLKSCEFNIDSGCVEICFSDGSMLAIDCALDYAKLFSAESWMDT